MTLALGERFRLHAIGFGLSYRPSVVIRQHTLTDVSLAELAEGGLMPLELARFLDAAILARKSIVISGDQGAGKTTLLRALIHAIPANERFGTLETDYELMTHLQPGRENILALQARTGHGETSGGTRVGEVTISDLMPEALRQNLSRLVVGEVRGGEAAAMFEAMQAGTGTLSTTHSHSAESTIDRLASRVAQGGVLTIDEAYRQIAHNIHLLVHVRLQDDTWKGGVAAPVRVRGPPGRPGHRERPAGHPPDLLRHRHRRPSRRASSPTPTSRPSCCPFRRPLPDASLAGTASGDGGRRAGRPAARRRALAAGRRAAPPTAPARPPQPELPAGARLGPVEPTSAGPARTPSGPRARRSACSSGWRSRAATGWLVALLVVPALALGLPYLLTAPRPRDIALLEALDRWVRSLSATLATGKSITDAIRISRRTAPPLLADEVETLVTRLNNRWDTREALMRMADALDSPDADAVLAALILASNRGANGASVTLQALGRLAAGDAAGPAGHRGRALEALRRRPTGDGHLPGHAARWPSRSRPAFFAPYRSPLGQLVLSVLLTVYLGSLLLMRRKAQQRERPRVLVGAGR